MSAETPIFPATTNPTPVNEIARPKEDPRRARVSKVHREIAQGVKDGSIYRDKRKRR